MEHKADTTEKKYDIEVQDMAQRSPPLEASPIVGTKLV